MRIVVCLKYVSDPTSIEVDPLTGAIDPVRTLYMLNPADAAALEMALRLRVEGDSVLALTVGPPEAEAVLRDALAVGADRVLRLWDNARSYTKPPVTSVLLAAALRLENPPDLVLCGARSVDRGSGKLPALLGELLDWPVVTDVTHFELHGQRIQVQRRLARGARAEGEVTLPAVLGLEPGLARLRQASLPGLITAKRATIPVLHLAELGLSSQDLHFPAVTLHAVMPPRPRPRALFMPDSHLPAHERIAQIMSAGVSGKSGKVLEGGSADDMADAIIAFLQEQGFLESVT
ncbi:MAG: electron transfer flavoprotein subunit beta/FixA family protein [Gammaproteobacteria bacterium]|nr:electron transfer flavoprotein subunit beta/FixA family protein [Gammaproteobacteria bacterium]MCP5426480.1 electron transfer flavoprotein subunit beta/FixA family protein [Gammaproteobacteria bacterium]